MSGFIRLVKDLPLPKDSVMIAITRNDSVIIPKGDKKILVEGDILVLACEDCREEINEIFG